MMDLLQKDIERRLPSEYHKGIPKVLRYFRHFSFKRNELILREGEICKYIYFIAKGCIQVFRLDESGNEVTSEIVIENYWYSSIDSFNNNIPTKENIRALEPVELYAMHVEDFNELMVNIPQFRLAYNTILEKAIAKYVERVSSFLSLGAVEKVKWISDRHPQLLTRVPSKVIASFLGITQETLSRVRGKI